METASEEETMDARMSFDDSETAGPSDESSDDSSTYTEDSDDEMEGDETKTESNASSSGVQLSFQNTLNVLNRAQITPLMT